MTKRPHGLNNSAAKTKKANISDSKSLLEEKLPEEIIKQIIEGLSTKDRHSLRIANKNLYGLVDASLKQKLIFDCKKIEQDEQERQLEFLIKEGRGARHLVIRNYSSSAKDFVKGLFENLPMLQYVDFSQSSQVDDEVIEHLAANCLSLKNVIGADERYQMILCKPEVITAREELERQQGQPQATIASPSADRVVSEVVASHSR